MRMGEEEPVTMFLILSVSWNPIKSLWVGCDKGPDDGEFPSTTKMTDEFRIRNYNLLEVLNAGVKIDAFWRQVD